MKAICVALLFIILFLPYLLFSRVLRIENLVRMPVMADYKFGNTGSYEYFSGTMVFGINPKNEANKTICDIDLAKLNKDGLIEARSKFIVLQATDPAKRNGIAFIEVSNRGGIALTRYYNNATTGLIRPNVPADYGNEYLMKEGYTLVWVGWQWDLPDTYNALRMTVPMLKNRDSTEIRGFVRSDWVVDKLIVSPLGVGHRNMDSYAIADKASDTNVLTARKTPSSLRNIIPNDTWSFTQPLKGKKPLKDSVRINTIAGFEPGNIYELVYQAKNPVLAGYGLMAIRDIASYIKFDKDCPFPAGISIAQGISQTGRFLRQFLFDAMNKDESGRQVFDGMLIFMAGAGRGSFNHRFAQPSRDAHRYSSFDYPVDLYPFGSLTVEDPVTGQLSANRALKDSLKIFYINTGYEYWGRGASLIHTDPTGQSDLYLPPNERYFHIASMQHYAESLPDSTRRVYPQYDFFKGNPLNPLPCYKALLVQMKEWIKNQALPSSNQIPTIKEGSLLSYSKFKFPFVPGVDQPASPYIPSRLYFGPQWADQRIIDQEPPIKGDPYGTLVPAIDEFGNEMSGIRNIELRVPLATYTPWSLRYGLASPGEMDDFRGLFIPLPKEKINKTTRDMRPDLKSLYSDKDEYLNKVDIELRNLVKERFLLEEDIPEVTKQSQQLWDWVRKFYKSN